MKLKGRVAFRGKAEGEAIVTRTPFSFLGELEPATGKILSTTHEHYGKSLKNKVFVCPTGKGSSVGPGIAYMAKKMGTLPAAMIVRELEPVLAAAIIFAEIPAIDNLEQDPVETICTGDHVIVDAENGTVEIIKKDQ
jgi:predicted aconitase with swiveling domain